MMRFKFLALVMLVGSMSTTEAVAQSSVAAQDWSVGASPSVDKSAFTATDIATFLWPLLEDESSRATYAQLRSKSDPVIPIFVGEFTWSDLDHDGTFELIASVSTSPRLTFNQLVVVARRDRTMVADKLPTAELSKVADMVRDLDSDGSPELVVPTEYAAGTGAHRVIWNSVYDWRDGKLLDVSEQHGSFYQPLVDTLREDISQSQAALSDVPPAGRALAEEFIAGKELVLDRLLYVTRQDVAAPERRIDEWTNSNSVVLKGFALRVLATIPGPRAQAQLGRLSQDANPIVRESASSVLETLRAEGRLR